jgi:hypothetical protein
MMNQNSVPYGIRESILIQKEDSLMADFTCKINVTGFTAEVRPGSTVRAKAVVSENNLPVRSVIFSESNYGIRQSFKKESDDTFILNYMVPYDAPGGNYTISVWAVSEEGDRSEAIKFKVVIK